MQRAFDICFAAVVIVFGGVSLSTNQRLYRFVVKPRFELVVFPAEQSRLSVCGALPETAECLDDFETIMTREFWLYVVRDLHLRDMIMSEGHEAILGNGQQLCEISRSNVAEMRYGMVTDWGK